MDGIRSSFQNIDTFNHDQANQIHDSSSIHQPKVSSAAMTGGGVSQPTPRYAFLDLPTAAQTNNTNFMFNSMSSQQQQHHQQQHQNLVPDYFSSIPATSKDMCIAKSSALCSAIKSEVTENGSISKSKVQEAIVNA